MPSKILPKLILSLIAVCSMLALGQKAYAEETQLVGGFTVSPTDRSLVLTPGEKYDYTIEVSNPSMATSAITVKAQVAPFSILDGSLDYSVDFQTESSNTMITDWIKIENPKQVIEPNEVATIRFRIEVPKDAPAGGQYATINVQRVREGAGDGNVGISESMEIASLVYAMVLGETNESGEIVSNSIAGFSFTSDIKADSIIHNTGNIHASAFYSLRAYPLFSKKEIYNNENDPDSIVLLPDQSYYKLQQWKAPRGGIFKVVQSIDFAGSTFEATKYVIICPIWFLIFVSAIIVVVVVRIIVKRRKKL